MRRKRRLILGLLLASPGILPPLGIAATVCNHLALPAVAVQAHGLWAPVRSSGVVVVHDGYYELVLNSSGIQNEYRFTRVSS